MPYMTRVLADVKAEFGDYLETVPGWQTRGKSSFAPAGVVCHWTAGPKTGDRPSLNICVNGRSDLPGPLCQVFLTRAGKPIIVAAGRANHAGAGSWEGVKGNTGFYGIEAESSGADGWTEAQRRNYPRLVAALMRGLDRPAKYVCGHSEYATPHGRKTDINGWPMSAMRASVADGLAGKGTPGAATTPLPEKQKETFLMALTDSEQDFVRDALKTILLDTGKTKDATGRIEAVVTSVQNVLGSLRDRFETAMVAFARIDVNAQRGSADASNAAATSASILAQVDALPEESAKATRAELFRALADEDAK